MLPGETLDNAVHRTAAAAGIDLDHIAGYLGHHDLLASDDVTRTFVFAATTRPGPAGPPNRSCPHHWAHVDDLPDALHRDMLAFLHLAAPATADHPDPAPLPVRRRSHARGR